MWKQKGSPPTEEGCRKLNEVRKQQGRVKRAEEKCNEIVSAHKTVKAQRFDGMPHSKKIPVGMDGSASQAEALLSLLEAERGKLKKSLKEAKKVVDNLPPEIGEFCEYYYLRGMSIKETAWMLDKCERTCWGYKAFVEQEAQEEQKAATAGG